MTFSPAPHTASDFSPPAPGDRGYAHQRRAIEFDFRGHYADAIEAYRASISAFEESTAPTARKCIAIAEQNIARLEKLVANGGAR